MVRRSGGLLRPCRDTFAQFFWKIAFLDRDVSDGGVWPKHAASAKTNKQIANVTRDVFKCTSPRLPTQYAIDATGSRLCGNMNNLSFARHVLFICHGWCGG